MIWEEVLRHSLLLAVIKETLLKECTEYNGIIIVNCGILGETSDKESGSKFKYIDCDKEETLKFA